MLKNLFKKKQKHNVVTFLTYNGTIYHSEKKAFYNAQGKKLRDVTPQEHRYYIQSLIPIKILKIMSWEK